MSIHISRTVNQPCLRLGGAYTRDPNELVRREAGPPATSLPGPWSEAPNAPPGSPGCARPMSLDVVNSLEVRYLTLLDTAPTRAPD